MVQPTKVIEINMITNYNKIRAIKVLNFFCVFIFLFLALFFINSLDKYEDFYRSPKTSEEYIEFTQKAAFSNRYNCFLSNTMSSGIRDMFSLEYVDMWNVKFRLGLRFTHCLISLFLTLMLWFICLKVIYRM